MPGEVCRRQRPHQGRQESEPAGSRGAVRRRAPVAFPDGTDLVLVWGEGFDFAGLPRGAKVIFLNSYLQPENGHADVFVPISVQTERNGHYTNFQGTVSEFRACFGEKPGVADAEEVFAALATRERAAA